MVGDGDVWVCGLCPHRCRLAPGATGFCGVRENRDGVPVARSYARVSSLHLDPIEKKPLSHFHPGSRILSVGLYGCSLDCAFCQNHAISKETPDMAMIPPEQLVQAAVDLRPEGNIGIAYTYNEPTVGIEYVLDCARLARGEGLLNVLVTSGYLEPEPWADLMKWTDACNIDLKAFHEDFYRTVCRGSLAPVLENIRTAAASSHVELTCLIVPGLNDGETEMDEMARWIARIDPGIPLHVSRYFPRYRMSVPATPPETVMALARTAARHLRHVHVGNL